MNKSWRYWRTRILAGAALVAVLAACSQHPAYADTIAAEGVVTLPPVWVPIVSGFLTSGLTALFTKLNARGWVKSLVGILLVGLSAVGQDIGLHGAFVWHELGELFLLSIATHLMAYLMVLKPAAVPAQLAPTSGLS